MSNFSKSSLQMLSTPSGGVGAEVNGREVALVSAETNPLTGGSIISASGMTIFRGKTSQEKLAQLGPRPVGFNYYSLVYEKLINAASAIAAQSTLLAWIASTGAKIVRIALPVFASDQYLTLVHSTATMPATMQDGNLKASYVAAVDNAMSLLSSVGLKAHVCDFWGQDFLPAALGETRQQAYATPTSATANYAKSAAEWFFRRYKEHAAFGTYSIGNEYVVDESGVAGPTTTQLGAWFATVAAAGRAVDATKIITTDALFLAVSNSASRTTLDQFAATARTLFAGLDAYCFHVYGSGFAYVGCSANEDAAFPNSSSTDLGYEGSPALMESLRALADADGKAFIIGECGIPTDEESDATLDKKYRALRAYAQYADYALVWNVQETTLANTLPAQVKWFIHPGTTRANSFLQVVTGLNNASITPDRLGGGLVGLKQQLQPRHALKCSRAAQGYAYFQSAAAHASAAGYSLMLWLRLDSALNSNEMLMSLQGDNTYGVALIANAAANSLGFYFETRSPAGSKGNTVGALPDVAVGEWNHFAFSSEGLNGSAALKIVRNGLYWRTIPVAGYPTSIAAAVNMFIGGYNSGNGSPISVQDVCLAGSISMQDVWDHMNGKVIPGCLLHMRARPNKTVLDLSKNALTLNIGPGATVVQCG